MYRPTYISSSAPTVNDDYGSGFREGNFWWDDATGTLYVLEDHTTGSADWVAVTSSTVGEWDDWTPTFTWAGGSVGGFSYVARYIQIGNKVTFILNCQGTVSAGADVTGLTISLPVTPTDVNMYVPVLNIEVRGTTFARTSIGYVDAENNNAAQRLLKHEQWSAMGAGVSFRFAYWGEYETS